MPFEGEVVIMACFVEQSDSVQCIYWAFSRMVPADVKIQMIHRKDWFNSQLHITSFIVWDCKKHEICSLSGAHAAVHSLYAGNVRWPTVPWILSVCTSKAENLRNMHQIIVATWILGASQSSRTKPVPALPPRWQHCPIRFWWRPQGHILRCPHHDALHAVWPFEPHIHWKMLWTACCTVVRVGRFDCLRVRESEATFPHRLSPPLRNIWIKRMSTSNAAIENCAYSYIVCLIPFDTVPKANSVSSSLCGCVDV